eukprot:jgi/Picsp_1/2884/NSC_01109-R1_-dimethyl-8-ribityllumazine synthase precursor
MHLLQRSTIALVQVSSCSRYGRKSSGTSFKCLDVRVNYSKSLSSGYTNGLFNGNTNSPLPTRFGSSRSGVEVRADASGDYIGSLIGTGMKFAIVVGRFNDLVTKLLLQGALDDFERHGVAREDVDVVWVPGSFELPVVAKSLAKSAAYDGVVAIGVVVRGATSHYDAVVAGATSGVLGASTDSGVPVIFGVLTCDTMEQALDRAGGKVGNKGGEAAVTAIETASVLKKLRAEGKAAGPW